MKEVEGVEDPDDSARYTNEIAYYILGKRVHAAYPVESDAEEGFSRLVAEEEAKVVKDFQFGVWWTEGGDRSPRVDGRTVDSASCVDATYCVRAGGGGEIRLEQFCGA